MKKDKPLWIKAGSLILVFLLLLFGGMLMLPYLQENGVYANDPFSSPEIKIDTPTSQELMIEKFAQYNTVSDENGKSVVTVFSQKTSQELKKQREQGEWFSLTTHEMIYLIDNTYELFKKYDVVKIYDREGKVHKYYGVSFYSSEEYLGLFGKWEANAADASFAFTADLYNAITIRAEMLCDSFVKIEEKRFVGFDAVLVTDSEKPLTERERNALAHGINPWRKGVTDLYGNPLPESARMHCGIWRFDSDAISFHRDASQMEYSLQADEKGEMVRIYPTRFDLSYMGLLKYDSHGNVVVVELCKRESGEVLGRLRFDDINDPEVIEKLMALQKETFEELASAAPREPAGDYYAVVYFNDFLYHPDILQYYYVYCPDGDTDLYSINGYEFREDEHFFYCGGKALGEYLNQLLKEAFGNQL